MAEHAVLMRLVRATHVLDGVPARPGGEGALVTTDGDPLLVPWSEVDRALGDDDPVSPAARVRLEILLTLRRAVHDLGDAAADVVAAAARPLALPTGHPVHPGPGWVRRPVPGGLLDLGLGVARLVPEQVGVLPLPPAVVAAAGLDPDDLWPRLGPLAERLGGYALDRVAADGPHPGVLGAVGGCDALTLLTLDSVRDRLQAAGQAGRPVAAPRRDRVWLDPATADPAYLGAVRMLTPAAQRGPDGPVAVGRSGVTRGSRAPDHS